MRPYLTIISFCTVLFIFCSCKKEKDNVKNLDIEELKGRWIVERIIEKQTGNIDFLKNKRRGSLTFHGLNCVNIEAPCKIGPGIFEINENSITISIISIAEPDIRYYEEQCYSVYCGLCYQEYDEIFLNNINGKYYITGNKLFIESDGEYNLEFFKSENDFSFPCFDEDTEILIDSIPENNYYDTSIFNGDDTLIYGKWMLVKKLGVKQLKPDFHYFEAKNSGIYSIIRNDSILEYGKLEIFEKTNDQLKVTLIDDENSKHYPMLSRLKNIKHYGQNIMVWQDACTDCYWFLFIRKK